MELSLSVSGLASEALRHAVKEWETWSDERLPYGEIICIRVVDGSILRSDQDNRIVGGDRQIEEGSLFRLVDPKRPDLTTKGRRIHSGSKVALRHMSSANFVSADFDRGGQLTVSWATEVRGWETFRLQAVGRRSRLNALPFGTRVTLLVESEFHSEVRWWYLRYWLSEDQRVSADADIAQEWEHFVIANPLRPH